MKINKRVIQSGYESFAFPKMKTVKVKPDAVKRTESSIQSGVDELLEIHHLVNLRLPDDMFRAIKFHPQISNKMRSYLLAVLSGWPDNSVFKYLCQFGDIHIGLVCHIENKTETGRLHGKQKIRAKELGFNECQSLNDAVHIIKTFNKFHQFFSQMIRKYAEQKQAIEKVGQSEE